MAIGCCPCCDSLTFPLPIGTSFWRDGQVLTVPDCAWLDAKLAVYCDSFAFHSDHEALVSDDAQRKAMQREGWAVLTYWGRTLNRRPEACAKEIAEVSRQRLAMRHRLGMSHSGG